MVIASTAVVSSRQKARPPSRAGRGSRFITARFTAMKAPKYRTFKIPSMVLSAAFPVSEITETIPTGPDISRNPAWPLNSICRLSRTIRAKSMQLYQASLRTRPRVFSAREKVMP